MIIKALIFTVIVFCLIVIGWKFLPVKKELPFQEIVPLDHGIAVINTANWYVSHIKIYIICRKHQTGRKALRHKCYMPFSRLIESNKIYSTITKN